MIVWLVAGLYVAGYLVCWRTVCWWFATDEAMGDPVDGEDLVFGVVLGSVVTLFWPPVAIGLLIRRVYRWRGAAVQALVIPRAHKRRIALDERERRIKALERELGLK